MTAVKERIGQVESVTFDEVPRVRDAAPAPRLRVLHVTAEYPDLNKPINTMAVKNFVAMNTRADHFVLSINRTARPWQTRVTDGGGSNDPRLVSIRYFGLPFGLGLLFSMYVVAMLAHGILQRRNVHFDVIHAHKLAFEGLIGYWLSRWTGKPLVCSIRGEVEDKVFRFKPTYAPIYRRVTAHCRRLYYVSAWFRREMHRRFSISPAKERLLPNFVDASRIPQSASFNPNTFVSIMCFDAMGRKGLDMLVPAFRKVVDDVPEAKLDLIGRFGTPERLKQIKELIDSHGLGSSVRIVGEVENSQLVRRLGTYAGFVLVSRNETFGMSYVEALLAGVPIVYSKGTGIDGYVDGIDGAIGADPYWPLGIGEAMLRLIRRQHELRDWLRDNRRLVLDRFGPDEYLAAYNRELLEMVHATARKSS